MQNKRIIRLANSGDYDGYYNIKADKNNVFWGGFTSAPDYETLKIVYASRLTDSNRREYVYEIDGKIVGYLAAVIVDSSVEITVGVLSQFSGFGIATDLAAFVSKEFSHKDIVAWVSEKNIASEKFLLKNDFKKTSEVNFRYLESDLSEHIFYKWVRKSVS